MRLLHTSDWHVGRTFHGHDLLDDQRAVLAALADLAAEHAVDAVLISGDVYDRAVPSADAMQVAARAVTGIRAAGADIVAIAGNHDSAPRLGVFTDVLEVGGLHLRTDPRRIADPVLLQDGDGPIAVYAIPYLEPEVVRAALGLDGSGPLGHQAVLEAAMAMVRADLASRPAATRSVVLAHAFVVGGAASGSERSIAVGGVESVASTVFDGIDYVALGHLHGRQRLSDRMRYSGSPLPYSFTESGHRKGAWLVDLGADGVPTARWLDLPVVRPLATVRGTLDQILSEHDDLADHYLAVELTDPVRPADPMRRLRECFPFAVTLSWQPDGVAPQSVSFPAVTATAPDEDIVEAFLADCRGAGADPGERQIIASALAALRSAEVTA
ncbi:MAG TPA: exonuclease SbcCD subunit D [Nakamurella sp.]|nr:exonuclease SbcCD subunit D [Nakamurella sp.]